MSVTGMNRLRFKKDPEGGFSNKEATGKLPEPLPSPLLLNLGCGNDFREGFINIDLFSENPEVVRMDIRRIDLPDNSADFILASDVLEHFSHREIAAVLKEWSRTLKPAGEIIIRCPSLKLQANAYVSGKWNADIASYMIFGGQTNPGDYHCAAFDDISIRYHLEKAGFEIIDIEEHDIPQDKTYINLNMTVRARKKSKTSYDQPTLGFEQPAEIENFASDVNYCPSEVLDQDSFLSDFDFGPQEESADEKSISDDYFTDIPESLILTLIKSKNENIVPSESPVESETNNLTANIEKEAEESFDDYDLDLLREIVYMGEKNQPAEIEEEFDLSLLNEVIGKMSDKSPDIKPEVPSELPSLNIVWEGSQFVWHSLALINREHTSNLIDTGKYNVTVVPYEEDQFNPAISDKFVKIRNHDIRFKADVSEEVSNLPYVWIRHQWPPKSEAPAGAKWIIMQPWEYTSLRRDFVDIFNRANEIWTPSNFSRNAFVNSGLDFNKVQVIPNGIDPKLFTPSGSKFKLNTNKRLKFLFVGGTIFRKGIDVLLRAYASEFTSADDVCLVIKDMGGDSFYKNQTAKNEILKLAAEPNAPEIIYIEDYLGENEMASLYRSCSVFVSPYRGEGYSLPTLEAMACGIPVIVTKGGATEDFVDESCGWLINAAQRSIGNAIDGKPLVSEAFILEPDENDLKDILFELFRNPSVLASKGMVASYKARYMHTWKRATRKIISRLDYLYGFNISAKADEMLKETSDSNIILGKAEDEFNLGNFDNSLSLFKEAMLGDLDPKYRNHSCLRSALILINEGKIAEAIDMISAAEKINPDHSEIHYVRSILYSAEEKYTEALEEVTLSINSWEQFKTECTLGVALDEVLCLTGDLMYAMGDLDSAMQIYTSTLKINDKNAFACYGAGLCFKNSESFAEARTMFEWALTLKPDFEDAARMLESIEGK